MPLFDRLNEQILVNKIKKTPVSLKEQSQIKKSLVFGDNLKALNEKLQLVKKDK